MRIAVVSDIHGNLTALEAVLADLDLASPDLILQGGDLAYGGARPGEVVDRVRELGWPGVRGNTDEVSWDPAALERFFADIPKLHSLCVTIAQMIPPARERLGEERVAWLESQPEELRSGNLALVHASPGELWRAPLPEAGDAELEAVYRPLGAPVVAYGHIHRGYIRRLSGLTVANAGSVSLSYDGDPRASYLLVDDLQVTIRRVEYDLEREIAALLRSGLPHADWIAKTLRAGRYVPPE